MTTKITVKILLTLIVNSVTLIVANQSFGQLTNDVFYRWRTVDPQAEGQIYLSTDAMLFTKNNEYFNKIADGYTLYGFQFSPYLTYQPSNNVRIDAGIYTQKDFGNPDFTEVSPLLTVMFDFGPIKQIIGNLDGSLNHRLIEPLYDFERGLINRQETGAQTIFESERTFFDLWIDWETMIYPGDSLQEEVSGGISFTHDFVKGPHTLTIPFQLVLYHRGGQIDAIPDPIATLWNSAVGFGYKYLFPEQSIFSHIRSENYYAYYKDYSPQQDQLAFNDGDGWYFNLALHTHFDLEFMTSYWIGNEFLSIKGGQLYQSVSSTFKNPDFVQPRRELLIFRFMHDLHLTDEIAWTTRIEPYYNWQKWQFSFGFYLNFFTDFYLGKAKREAPGD